jgi:hypothetical protein
VQDTGYVNVANYRRVVVIIKAIAVGTSLNADVEITTDGVSAGLHTLKSITELGGSDDDAVVLINVRDEELSKPTDATSQEYDWINIETTPSGTCSYVVFVFGIEPRYEPVGTSEWDEVVA